MSDEELDLLDSKLIGISTKIAHVRSDHKTYDDNIRQSRVAFIHDFVSFQWLYQKISIAVHEVNSYNFRKLLYGIEPLQYSEYDSLYKGFYGIHSDEFIPEVEGHFQRSLSFSLQLSAENEYTGGELVINFKDKNKIVANKNRGSITFFDSRLDHEVTPVTSGFRKSLVGWVMGPRV
tara:strand:- start:4 stop:534 length:531 start_codon:yes stop_codon:yes gene_type:complete